MFIKQIDIKLWIYFVCIEPGGGKRSMKENPRVIRPCGGSSGREIKFQMHRDASI